MARIHRIETEGFSKKGIFLVLAIVGGITALVASTSLFAVVEPGERGVYVLFGEAREEALEPGLHWKNPLATIVRMNVRQVVFDQTSEASSSDLQTIHAGIAVNYRPVAEMSWKLYKDVGAANKAWEQVLLRPAIQEITKAVTAKFTAEELIKKRAETKAMITDQIVERLRRENILVTELSITDFGFNKAFNEAIEAKQIAEQKAKQAQNELRRVEIEAQQKVVQAEANKKAQILDAEGQAAEVEILGTAEAQYQERIGASATALGLKMRMLERWDGQMPQVVGSEGLMLDMGLMGGGKKTRRSPKKAATAG